MAQDLRKVNDIESLMIYFSEKLGWAIARMITTILMILHMISMQQTWD